MSHKDILYCKSNSFMLGYIKPIYYICIHRDRTNDTISIDKAGINQ